MSEETKKDSNVEEQDEIQDEQLEGASGGGVEREMKESGEKGGARAAEIFVDGFESGNISSQNT